MITPARRRPVAPALTRILATLTTATAAALAGPSPATAETDSPLEREIIVQRQIGLSTLEQAEFRERAQTELVEQLEPGVELVRVRVGGVDNALSELRRDPRVVYAELNRPVGLQAAEPLFRRLWGFRNTGQAIRGTEGRRDADADVDAAWKLSRGSGQVVAMVDSGINLEHEDLRDVVRRNPGESGSGREHNRRDDDRNGYVDDWRGWDFTGHGDGDNRPADYNGHGTHTAGTVAAAVNGRGVVGVGRKARIVPIRITGAHGRGKLSDMVRAFDYASRLGIPIVNVSVSGNGTSRPLREAMARHPKTLYVASAGNSGRDVDAKPQTPCAETSPNVICVGASTNREQIARFSNYGDRSVDLFAPGLHVLSTYRGGGYDYLSGTSMAAPHVAGALALMRERAARWSAPSLKTALLRRTDRRAVYSRRSVSGGRLNAARAVAATDR
ncbi:MAG: S8 family serine peptidase [Thermoleophilaceae bacterium]|nr:S8 family serine peptidase [Thermoleophilaceae bacterium]